MSDVGAWGVPLAIFSGSIKVGTPFLFVSLGECVTEKAGRVNLGLEGTLLMGAMTGFGISYLAEGKWGIPGGLAPWMGVLAAGVVGALMGALHAAICNRPKVNAVAVGIGLMIFGYGLAAYLGTPLNKVPVTRLPDLHLGSWSSSEAVQRALQINGLFLVGLVLVPLLAWMLKNTRWGLMLRLAGESEEAAAAMGYSVARIRLIATTMGGVLAGVAGSFLSLSYPGLWKENISSGQGLVAVALVIFARWNPWYCLWASLLFGGIGSIGQALQVQGLASKETSYLWNTAPYVLTLGIMILTSSRARAMIGAPLELSRVR